MTNKKLTEKEVKYYRRNEYHRSKVFKDRIKKHKKWLEELGYVITHPNGEYLPPEIDMNPYYEHRIATGSLTRKDYKSKPNTKISKLTPEEQEKKREYWRKAKRKQRKHKKC